MFPPFLCVIIINMMILSQEEQEKIRASALGFLNDHNTMVVSTVSDAGEPQAATVYFTVGDDFSIYFMTSHGSRKCENLKSNGKIAFVVGTGPEVATIQGGGNAESLDEQEAQVFYKLIEKVSLRSPWQWPVTLLAKEGYCTFKITPTWMVWLNLHKEQYPDIASEEFYKII